MSTQTMPECMDRHDYLPNARVWRWAMHQMAGARRTASPQVAHRFEAFQKVLPRHRVLQSPAVPQPITRRHVATLDSFGREPDGPVQPRPDVLRTCARGRYSLDIRLVVIGHHLVRDHPATLDRMAKEGLRTRRIAVLTQ